MAGRKVDMRAELARIGLAYQWSPVSTRPAYARATCVACNAHEDFRIDALQAVDHVRKTVLRGGWYEDHGLITRCPNCPHRQKDRTNQERIMDAIKPVTNGTPDTLTPAQKQALRQQLDTHFDDAKGMYLDQWSDEAVSAATKINRLMVTEFRELCYGPLKADGDLLACKSKLEEVRALATRLHEGINSVDSHIVSLEQRLKETARKLGVSL